MTRNERIAFASGGIAALASSPLIGAGVTSDHGYWGRVWGTVTIMLMVFLLVGACAGVAAWASER